MITPKLFNEVAQLSHVGWGLAIVFAPKVLFGGHWYLLFLFLWTIYCAIKEFWYDQKYEAPDVRGSSLDDFLHAVVAALIAAVLTFLFGG